MPIGSTAWWQIAKRYNVRLPVGCYGQFNLFHRPCQVYCAHHPTAGGNCKEVTGAWSATIAELPEYLAATNSVVREAARMRLEELTGEGSMANR